MQLPTRPYPDLAQASDRVWHASRLYFAGKAERIILSGGKTPESGDDSEARAMRIFLINLGVPDKAIQLEEGSESTATNARLTYDLLSKEKISEIILVTSALHMPRARMIFQRAGFKVVSAPTDIEVIERPLRLVQFLPDAEALSGSGRAMKEILGLLVSS